MLQQANEREDVWVTGKTGNKSWQVYEPIFGWWRPKHQAPNMYFLILFLAFGWLDRWSIDRSLLRGLVSFVPITGIKDLSSNVSLFTVQRKSHPESLLNQETVRFWMRRWRGRSLCHYESHACLQSTSRNSSSFLLGITRTFILES